MDQIRMRIAHEETLDGVKKRLNNNLLMYCEKYRPMIEYFYPVLTMAESGLFNKKMKLSIDQSRITSDFTKKFDIVHVAWKNLVSIQDDDAFATLMRQTQEPFQGQGEMNALHALKFRRKLA